MRALSALIVTRPCATLPKLSIAHMPVGLWPSVLALAFDGCGCRLLQSVLDDADNACRVAIASTFKGSVCEAVASGNANHVLQRLVELIAPAHVEFIAMEICRDASPVKVAKHRYGCRVIERMLEHFPEYMLWDVFECLLDCTLDLSAHMYGNFVVQHILEHGSQAHKLHIIQELLPNIAWAARDPNAIGVVDSALCYAPREWQETMARELLFSPEVLLYSGQRRRRANLAAERVMRILGLHSSGAGAEAQGRRGPGTTRLEATQSQKTEPPAKDARRMYEEIEEYMNGLRAHARENPACTRENEWSGHTYAAHSEQQVPGCKPRTRRRGD